MLSGLPGAERLTSAVKFWHAYDLRHACLSTWLNGGVFPTQVAGWAGHGVDVLLRIYTKCVVGQDELAKRGSAKRCARTDHGCHPPF